MCLRCARPKWSTKKPSWETSATREEGSRSASTNDLTLESDVASMSSSMASFTEGSRRNAISEILKYSVFVKYLRLSITRVHGKRKLYDERRRSSFSGERFLKNGKMKTRRASLRQWILVHTSEIASCIDATSNCFNVTSSRKLAAVNILMHRCVLIFNTEDANGHPFLLDDIRYRISRLRRILPLTPPKYLGSLLRTDPLTEKTHKRLTLALRLTAR